MLAWKIEAVKKLKGIAVEHVSADGYLVSRRNRLYHTFELDGLPRLIGTVPASKMRMWAAYFRLGQRLLRFMFTNVIPLGGERYFVSFDKSVGMFENGRFIEVPTKQAFRILRGACAVGFDGGVYFGEYFPNTGRTVPVRIYRFDPVSKRLDVVYTFPPGVIRHIHGIYTDPYAKSLWCLTGDFPAECRILRTSDHFDTVEAVGQGDESWRAVSILFTADGIYYGSDAEYQQNNLYRIDRHTGERQTLAAVDGTVFYSVKIGDQLLFGSTAELTSSQNGKTAQIWHISPDDRAVPIFTARKDLRGNKQLAKYFMYGLIHFSYGESVSRRVAYAHLVALQGYDNRVIRIEYTGE